MLHSYGKMVFLGGLLVSSLAASAAALPSVTVKRQVSQLRDKYDFIIAGGGTSGLTVADRLSQAFPKSRLSLAVPNPDQTLTPRFDINRDGPCR